jgi:hypothetical protein
MRSMTRGLPTNTRLALAAVTAVSAAVCPAITYAQATGSSFAPTASAAPLRSRPLVPDPLRPEATNEDEEILRRNYWTYRSVTAVRLNPLGLFSDLRFSYRSRLYQNVDTIFREAYVAFTPTATISPAWGRLGAVAEVQPLAILNLSVGGEFIGMVGTFDTLQSWASPQSRVSERDQDVGGANKWNYRTTGFQLTLGALLELRLANAIVLRSNVRAFYHAMNTRVPTAMDGALSTADPLNAGNNASDNRGTRVWYDILNDLVLPANGWSTHIDSDLLYAPEGEGISFGLRHSYTQAFFAKSDFRVTDVCAGGNGMTRGSAMTPCAEFLDPNGALHRLGPLIAYNFRESNHARFNAPTVFVAVQWWMSHRYRMGTGGGQTARELALGNTTAPQDFVDSAIPYFAAGFSFRGDLLYPRR